MNDLELLSLINRKKSLFQLDISNNEAHLNDLVAMSSFLVIGGAGSIGQAVVRELFRRNPRILHVVDISENNLVELVRDIRSSHGYIKGDFQVFSLDCGSYLFEHFMKSSGKYDYVLNLSALKHVRSEKDAHTLMRLIEVNILNVITTLRLSKENGAIKYFAVSSDKATNPVNMMGASKRIMELFLRSSSSEIPVSTARFANVAFSDGSLLYGLRERMAKQQPISCPIDIRRYFITPQESGELCLMACLLGENRDIFFPKLRNDFKLIDISDVVKGYLRSRGFEPVTCVSEEEARSQASRLIKAKKWPCYFFASDTTGEKEFEEFYTENQLVDMTCMADVGVIRDSGVFDPVILENFLHGIKKIRSTSSMKKSDIVDLFKATIPEFQHIEIGKNLDQKM